jgi:hypothetical protein
VIELSGSDGSAGASAPYAHPITVLSLVRLKPPLDPAVVSQVLQFVHVKVKVQWVEFVVVPQESAVSVGVVAVYSVGSS